MLRGCHLESQFAGRHRLVCMLPQISTLQTRLAPDASLSPPAPKPGALPCLGTLPQMVS